MNALLQDDEYGDSKLKLNLIATLARRWEYMALGICLGVSMAALYFFTAVPVFQSDIEILVGQRSSELTNSGTITGAHASGDAIQEDQLATHMRLLISRKLLSDAVKQGGLAGLDSFKAAASRGISPIDHLIQNVVVKRGGDGTARDAMVLRASYRDPSASNAAAVLEAVYASYRNYVESHSENSSEQAVTLIEEARKTHEEELAIADMEYREFVQAVPALFDGDKLQDVHKERMANLEIELNTVRNHLAEQQSRLEVIESYVSGNASKSTDERNHLALLSQKEVERLKLFLEMTRGEGQSEAFQAGQPVRQEAARVQYNRLLELIQKERALSDAFGASHPLVDMARKEITITQQFMETNAPVAAEPTAKKLDPEEMLKTYTLLLRNDISELQKRKAILIHDSEQEMVAAKLVENDYMRGSSLRARLNRAQARYDQVILRLQEVNLSRSYAGFSTDLLASPEPSSRAAWPKFSIIATLGLLCGICLGIAMSIVAELLDATFDSVADIESVTGANVIAHLKRFVPKKHFSQGDETKSIAASVIAFHEPRSAEAEVYRVARTSLMISNRKDGARTLMMTSPQPGDGKSTTVSNLAVSIARTGKRVLLIDADLRRPMIASLFGLKNLSGLADVLNGKRGMADCIHGTELPTLFIMPNGSDTSEPAELLESSRLSKLLLQAKESFDVILIDTPPLLAVADPAIIAPIVDSVILTVRVYKNGRHPVENAMKVLEDIDVRASAVIVNGVDRAAQKAYYGGYSDKEYDYVGHYHDKYSAKALKTEQRPLVVSGQNQI